MASSTSTKTRKTTNAVKIPVNAREPQDHAKGPRIRRVKVAMDDVAAQDLEDALEALQVATAAKAEERDRRVAVLMASRREAFANPPTERAHLDAARQGGPVLDDVRTEIDAAIVVELAPAEDAVAAARQRVADSMRTYTFQSIGNTKYQQLLGEHKPTEDDHAQVKEEGRGDRALYHAETFAPALVQRCSVTPKLSEADVEQMFGGDTWNLSEIALLFMAAYEVNTQRRVIPA